jgi:hypothetical protein
MTDLCWGGDLGDTKIEGVVLPPAESAEPLYRLRVPTERERGYEHVRRNIVGLVERKLLEVGEQPQAVGFGTPGTLDPATQTLKNSNTTCLIGQPLQRDLAADLGCRVELANDANCFAFAEARLGAGQGAPPSSASSWEQTSVATSSSTVAPSLGVRESVMGGATSYSTRTAASVTAASTAASKPSCQFLFLKHSTPDALEPPFPSATSPNVPSSARM